MNKGNLYHALLWMSRALEPMPVDASGSQHSLAATFQLPEGDLAPYSDLARQRTDRWHSALMAKLVLTAA